MSSKLMQRDYEILQHVLRYRITTREAIHRAVASKISLNGVTKITMRLVAHGWLQRHSSVSQSCYFTLSPKSALLFGTPEAAINEALSAPALLREHAALAYCCLSDKPRQRLIASEVDEEYPHLASASLKSELCYIDDGHRPGVHGLLRVDDGSPAAEVIAKGGDTVLANCKRSAFRKFVEEGRFRLTIVTATKEKAAVIKSCVKQRTWPAGLRTEIVVIPKLMNFVVQLQAASPAERRSNGRALSRAGKG